MAGFFHSRPITFKYDDVPDLTGQVALITGASTGIGKATMSALAKKGAHVVCVGRNPEKSKAAIAEVVTATGNDKIDYIEADLNDLKSVDKAATQFIEKSLPLHMLILNAGLMATPSFETSKDGIEKQFATNHFSHFLLTQRLLPTIEKTAVTEGQSVRVVALSSSGNVMAPSAGILMDKLNDAKSYGAWSRYGETKLANILFVKELQRRMEEKHGSDVKIYCNAVHPGVVHTELFRYAVPGFLQGVGNWVAKRILLTPEQGAMSSVFMAASPEVESKNLRGQFYWDQARPSKPLERHAKVEDVQLQKDLWTWTDKIVAEKVAEV